MTKKTILLALTLIMMSAASVNAQVRIGGMDNPNPSAVLDLNADDATNDGELGLALPRVELTSTTSSSPLQVHVAGMIVYNTATENNVTPGTYYNDGTKWIRTGSGTLTGAVNGGLTIINPLSTGDPYTVGITEGGVTTSRIADAAVTAAKLNDMGAMSNQVLTYNGSTWMPVTSSFTPCSGTIVYDGAYNGPAKGIYTTGLGGIFDPNWSSPVFTTQDRHLCWAKTNISGYQTWAGAMAACADLTTDNRRWRLPNLMELQVLYLALGGDGESVNALTALDTYGNGESGGADALSGEYWSSTEAASDSAFFFSIIFGGRGTSYSKTITMAVRCVRSL
jgi:hypothetical protein